MIDLDFITIGIIIVAGILAYFICTSIFALGNKFEKWLLKGVD